jgi:hypothetical protein
LCWLNHGKVFRRKTTFNSEEKEKQQKGISRLFKNPTGFVKLLEPLRKALKVVKAKTCHG